MRLPDGAVPPSATQVRLALDTDPSQVWRADEATPESRLYKYPSEGRGRSATQLQQRQQQPQQQWQQQQQQQGLQQQLWKQQQQGQYNAAGPATSSSSSPPPVAGEAQPQFVMTYLESTATPPVRMKKGDFVPHVFQPERPLLPLPGAQVTAAQYLFLEREAQAARHVLVPAELQPLSKTKKKEQQQRARGLRPGRRDGSNANSSSTTTTTSSSSNNSGGPSSSSSLSSSSSSLPAGAEQLRAERGLGPRKASGDLEWKSVEHFQQWQNAQLLAEIVKGRWVGG